MAQVFSTINAVVPAPILSAGYFPGIDIRQIDGRGLKQLWGGGPMSRQFQVPVVIGQEPSAETRMQQLVGLMIQALPMGNTINYNFQGLVGPASTIPGPPGPTTIVFARDIDGHVLNVPTRVIDDGTIPGTVSGVSATAMIQAVMLEWTANTELDIDHYVVYRHTSNDSGASSAILTAYATLIVDGNRTAGTAYYYWVKAVDYLGNTSAAYSTSVNATPTDVESADIVEIAANKVLISGATYLSNWRHSSDVTKIDGGDIYAASITLTKAANDLKGLAGDQVASGGASLLPNWRLDISDGNGRPAGIYPIESINNFDQIDWLDSGEAEIKILSTPDTTVGYGFPAIPIDDKQKYTIIIRHKSSAESADGQLMRLHEYNAALPATKTHIGFTTGGPNTQERTGFQVLADNIAMPGTSWVVDTFTYTPTAGTKYASLGFQLWGPDTAETEWHIDYVLMYVIPKTAAEIAETASLKWAAETGANITGDHTANDTSNVDGLTATSVSGWAHGSDTTKIDGGTIFTDSIVTNSLAANLITYSELRQVGGSEAVDTNAIRDDAVNIYESVSTAGTISVTGSTWTTIATITDFPSGSGVIEVSGAATGDNNTGGPIAMEIAIYEGSTQIRRSEYTSINPGNELRFNLQISSIPGSGNVTYYLKAYTGATLDVKLRDLIARESRGK